MKLLMAIVSVISASVAFASPAACVPGTEIVSGTFTSGAVLNSSLACTEYGVTFDNFSVTVVSNPDFSGNWMLSIGPATGSTNTSGMLEFDFTQLDPGDEFLLSYDMSFSTGPFSGEELTLETGPLGEVTEHICGEGESPCAVPLYAPEGYEGALTTLLPPGSQDSVVLDVVDGDRLYQTVFTPEPESFALAGCGVLGIGLLGLVGRRSRTSGAKAALRRIRSDAVRKKYKLQSGAEGPRGLI